MSRTGSDSGLLRISVAPRQFGVPLSTRSSWGPGVELGQLDALVAVSRAVELVARLRSGEPVGRMVIRTSVMDRSIEILDLAVRESHRRRGVGRTLVRRLTDDTMFRGTASVFRVRALVPDDLTACQLCLKSCGFAADRVVRQAFSNGADGYLMLLRRKEALP